MIHKYRFVLIQLLAINCLLLIASASLAQNVIIQRTYKEARQDDNLNGTTFAAPSEQAATQLTYFDGLGKPTQQIAAFGAANKGDVIVLTEYDAQFRPVRTYLPAPFADNGGTARDVNTIINRAKAYYTDNTKVSAPVNGGASQEELSARTEYVKDPLNRVSQQRAPGATAAVNQVYGINNESEVKRYRATGAGLYQIQLQGDYAKGELSYVQTVDENQNTVTQYQDRFGRMVLKRVANDDKNLDTYYVYNEQGQLRAVLQPQYSKADGNDLAKNAFLYLYDEQGRVVTKKVPGSNPEQLTYKGNTDLIATLSDGEGQVFYYNYDNLNRQTEMGVNGQALLRTYYDTYGFGPFQSYTNELGLTGAQFADNPQGSPRRGQVTGSWSRVLLANGDLGDWLQTVFYYDNKYRVIQTVRQLYGLGGGAHERVSYKRGFDGRVEQEWTTQSTSSGSYRLAKKYTYDHASRLLRTEHELFQNGVSRKAYTHVEQGYNEVGTPSAKALHEGLQLLTYKYTPRGWLGEQATGAGAPFSLQLAYQQNGNIARQDWTTKTHGGGMTLSYDKASRLIEATGQGGFAGNDEVGITYDNNGNLLSLTRNYNRAPLDQLSYGYTGNQLRRVHDGTSNQSLLVKGFINGVTADEELFYDGNGNLTRDDNRSINSIRYNVLNLPRQVSLRNGSATVNYIYDGSGTKHKSEAPGNMNTYYAGSFEYGASGQLQRIGLEEGQLVWDNSNNTCVVQYYLRDHLGNVRSVVDESGQVLQETEYYAFGLPIPQVGKEANKYLYNGKEQQPQTEWLDYGFRMYDPTVGRWMTIDPMANSYESHSPYNYVFNSPINWTDPDGMCPTCPQGEDAKDTYADGAEVTNQYGSWTWTGNGWRENTNIRAYVPSTADQWRTGDLLAKSLYGIADGFYSLFAGNHLGGRGFDNYDDKIKTRLGGLLTLTGPLFSPESNAARVGSSLIDDTAKASSNALDDIVIQFGKGENQIYHAFRHTDELGLNRGVHFKLSPDVLSFEYDRRRIYSVSPPKVPRPATT